MKNERIDMIVKKGIDKKKGEEEKKKNVRGMEKRERKVVK